MNASVNHRPQKLHRSSSGFTLIELMVTIAVLAIIVSIAAPSISTQLANQRVKSTAATLENALKEARVESVIRRQPLTLSFDDIKKVIRIEFVVLGMVESNIASYKYDVKSTISSVDSYAATVTKIEFKPNKTADERVFTICDSNNASSPITINVSTIGIISKRLEGVCS